MKKAKIIFTTKKHKNKQKKFLKNFYLNLYLIIKRL
jgi:hypothetical protein